MHNKQPLAAIAAVVLIAAACTSGATPAPTSNATDTPQATTASGDGGHDERLAR